MGTGLLRRFVATSLWNGPMSLIGTEPTWTVRCSVAIRWKADIEQAASVIVLLRGEALRLRQRRSGAGAIKESLPANG